MWTEAGGTPYISILTDFGDFSHKHGMVFVLLPWFKKKPRFHPNENQQKPFTNYVEGNVTLVWTRELIESGHK